MYLISSCLLGENCKYNGKNNYDSKIVEFSKKVRFVKACPEVLGGLTVPRDPCEIAKGKVTTKNGLDCTKEFELGAELTVEIAKQNKVEKAILKSKSPSCGVYKVYDGTFSGKLREGMGLTAKLLAENNIVLYSEEDAELLCKEEKSNDDGLRRI